MKQSEQRKGEQKTEERTHREDGEAEKIKEEEDRNKHAARREKKTRQAQKIFHGLLEYRGKDQIRPRTTPTWYEPRDESFYAALSDAVDEALKAKSDEGAHAGCVLRFYFGQYWTKAGRDEQLEMLVRMMRATFDDKQSDEGESDDDDADPLMRRWKMAATKNLSDAEKLRRRRPGGKRGGGGGGGGGGGDDKEKERETEDARVHATSTATSTSVNWGRVVVWISLACTLTDWIRQHPHGEELTVHEATEAFVSFAVNELDEWLVRHDDWKGLNTFLENRAAIRNGRTAPESLPFGGLAKAAAVVAFAALCTVMLAVLELRH